MEELKLYEDKMNKTLDVLLSDFGTIRAGRANPHVLDKIKVDYYGTPTPLQQVGNVSVPEARMIVIQPWEKSLLKPIEKAILTSELGINPTNDGNCIRLVFPEMTEERRKAVSKDVKKKGEGAKVALRNIRRDANEAFKKAEKAGDMSEDDLTEATERMQKLTDKMVEKIDKAVEEKTNHDSLIHISEYRGQEGLLPLVSRWSVFGRSLHLRAKLPVRCKYFPTFKCGLPMTNGLPMINGKAEEHGIR